LPRAFTGLVPRESQEVSMQDLLFIVLTIVAFAVLFLLIKGVERFER
jgi:hypothetical protein